MTEQIKDKKDILTRRQFLQTLGLLLASGALAACSEAQQAAEIGPDRYVTPTPSKVLQSPQPPAPEPTDVSPDLARFLVLSSVLTGFENLDPRVGQAYMRSIENNPDLSQLSAVYEAADFSTAESAVDLETLKAAQIFDQEPTRKLADEITKMWYTGVYTEDGEPKVATFVDSLAWKSLRYTKPATTCGEFGFWATEPQADVFR